MGSAKGDRQELHVVDPLDVYRFFVQCILSTPKPLLEGKKLGPLPFRGL